MRQPSIDEFKTLFRMISMSAKKKKVFKKLKYLNHGIGKLVFFTALFADDLLKARVPVNDCDRGSKDAILYTSTFALEK